MRPDENRSIQTVLNAATARSRREAVAGLSAIAALVVFPVNANAEPTMTETHLQQNKVVVANFIEVVWRQGRLGELGNYWSNNCVNHTDPATANIGLDQLRRYHEGFSQAFAGFTSTTIEIVQQVAEGDRVVTHLITKAIHATTGKHVSLSTIRIDRLQNQRIAEHWSVADMAGLMQQLQG